MRTRTNGLGIGLGVVGAAMSFASVVSAVVAGRLSEALLPFGFFMVASVAVAHLLVRRRAGR
jgi:hypothetical protein